TTAGHISRPSGPIQGLSWLDIVTTTPAVAHTHSSGAPEIFETLLAQFRVARSVLDGAMAEPILDCPRVVALVGQRVTAGVAQHVGVDLERKASACADALN